MAVSSIIQNADPIDPAAGCTVDAGYDALRASRFTEAAQLFMRHLDEEPADVGALYGLGEARKAQGDWEGAAEVFLQVLELAPTHAAALAGLSETRLKQNRLEEALTLCETAVLHSGPPQAAYFVLGGRILAELGRLDDAHAALTNAATLEPNNPDVYIQMALVLEAKGRPFDAFAAYQKALVFRPRDVLAYNNIAALLIGQGQLDLAVNTARVAVALAPDHPDVYLNLATALRLRGDDDEALSTYKTVIALKPDHGEALVELCHRRRYLCDWDGLERDQALALAHSYRQGRLVSPFAIMTATDSAQEQLLCARVFAARMAQHVAPLTTYAPRPEAKRRSKIRIGYLSADFHAHATAMLIADLIEQHDKSRFELYGYSLGRDDGSALRRRLVGAFDHFVDLRNLNDFDAAQRIRSDEIDILLDLKGYTQEARVKILAHRPAPIQINYLGFPGTMGAPFIDYIVADAHVAPAAHAAFFDEKIIHLPHCYQPNDRKRIVAHERPTRAAFGVPETAFVFCCFNNPYKITEEVFTVWMNLLREIPDAILWLLETNRLAVKNLRHEAERRGIAPERLVFSPFMGSDKHLARLALADLFLDTRPVNAHTTASECLWVGLPVLTCRGEAFASRVAASLLNAVDLPDLVTEDLAAYEAVALKLARDRAALAGIREKLIGQRRKTALFDTPRYARNFERALLHAVELRDSGLQPHAFAIPDDLA